MQRHRRDRLDSRSCHTGAAKTGTRYDEVITVYLQHPIAVCGNAVCEGNEGVATDAAYCPSDCHPGGWAHDLDFIGDIRTTGDTPNVTSPFRAGRFPFGDNRRPIDVDGRKFLTEPSW